jgi:protein TilB
MKSENCPEIRTQIAEKSRLAKGDNQVDITQREKKEKFEPKLFNESGRPYCLNMPKLGFTFCDEADRYELDLHVYKYGAKLDCLLFKDEKLLFFLSSFLTITHRYLDTSLISVDVEANYVRVSIKGKIFQMALNDEVRIDECTSKRSQTTGHLLIKMPKLNAHNAVCKSVEKSTKANANKIGSKDNDDNGLKSKLNGVVDINNIVFDDSDVPPLI